MRQGLVISASHNSSLRPLPNSHGSCLHFTFAAQTAVFETSSLSKWSIACRGKRLFKSGETHDLLPSDSVANQIKICCALLSMSGEVLPTSHVTATQCLVETLKTWTVRRGLSKHIVQPMPHEQQMPRSNFINIGSTNGPVEPSA